MVIRTYFDKNNTIVNNQTVNTGLNPVTELFYGGSTGMEKFSRFLFHFNEARLKDLDNNQLIIYHAGKNRLNPPWRITN